MKQLIWLLILVFTAIKSFGQPEKIEYILNSKISFVPQVKLDANKTENKIILDSKFASSEINNLAELGKIKGNVITKVELVYTTYKSTQSFDQPDLNKKRLKTLADFLPQILENEMVEWQLIGQTDCQSAEQGSGFFHGFIITYRPIPTAETTEKEIAELERLFPASDPIYKDNNKAYLISVAQDVYDKSPVFRGKEKELISYLKKSIKLPKKSKDLYESGYFTIVLDKSGEAKSISFIPYNNKIPIRTQFRLGKIKSKWDPATKDGKPVSISYNIFIQAKHDNITFESDSISLTLPKTPNYIIDHATNLLVPADSVFLSGRSIPLDSLISNYSTPDSTLLKVFNRNQDWNKMAIVCDLTGSMMPYTSQLLIWHKLNIQVNTKKASYFTFFNDGDLEQDYKKKIGSTGGIYQTKATNFEGIKELAVKTMKAGFGGDTPENNFEAVLETIKNCPECEEIVMIADNYATPRDIALLSKINKPIRFIMCGTQGGINPDYLNLARQNKGSIHTIEEDISNLMELIEGKEITISGRKYQIKNGKFIALYDL